MLKLRRRTLVTLAAFLVISHAYSGESDHVFSTTKNSVTRLSGVSDTDPDIKVALFSTQYYKPQRVDGYSYTKLLEMLALDCSAGTFITLQLSWMDKGENIVNQANYPERLKRGDWLTPGANSVAKKMVDFACSSKASG